MKRLKRLKLMWITHFKGKKEIKSESYLNKILLARIIKMKNKITVLGINLLINKKTIEIFS